RVYRNGRLVWSERRATEALHRDVTVPLVPGMNTFTAIAYSRAHVKRVSAPATVEGPQDDNAPVLHVIAAALDEYRDSTGSAPSARAPAEAYRDAALLNLKYAVEDARAFVARISERYPD